MTSLKTKILSALSHIKILPGTFDVSGEQTRSIFEQIQIGDIVIKGYSRYLDSYLRPGKYHFGGVYMGSGYVACVTPEGIEPFDIIDFCRCDHILILRVDDQDMTNRAIRRCEQFVEISEELDCEFPEIESALFSLDLITMCYKELNFTRTNNKLTDESLLTNTGLRLIYGNKVHIYE